MTNLLLIIAAFLVVLAVIAFFIKKLGKTWTFLLAASNVLLLIGLSMAIFNHFFGSRVEFLHPWAFLLLIVPFVVLISHTIIRTVFARTVSYSMTHLEVQQSSLRVLLTRWLPSLLYLLALLLMTAALARPVRIDRTVLPPTEGVDIILLMDVSASMQKNDFYPNRFVAAQQTAKRFIEKRLTDRIGLVAFAKSALLQAPLTLDHEALQEYIASMFWGW